MKLKRFKPTSPGLRHQVNVTKNLLGKKGRIIKVLLRGKKKQYGRSSHTGHITSWHRGGGVKSLYRDIQIPKFLNYSVKIGTFYDPNRNSFVSLCYNFFSSRFYNKVSTKNTYPGSLLSCYDTSPDLKLGILIKLRDVPIGSSIHSIYYRNKEKYIKSAGTFGTLLQKDLKGSKVKLPSGDLKVFPSNVFCVIGIISNSDFKLEFIGKAGRERLKGRRPHVRGVAMNPVDHPHGGQTSTGCPSVTPWGIPTKGKPTRKKKYVKS